MSWDAIDFIGKNIRHHLVKWILACWFTITPICLRAFLLELFLTISPTVPTHLKRFFSFSTGPAIFWWAYGSGVFLAFVLTGMLNYANGTFYGHDNNVIYFVHDYISIVQYVIVMPVATGLLCSIIAAFIQHHASLERFPDGTAQPSSQHRAIRLPLAMSSIPLISGFLIYLFIRDVIRISQTGPTYWFIDSATRALNPVGTYYVIINFIFLIIIVMALFCFFSVFFEMLRIGSSLESIFSKKKITWENISKKTGMFCGNICFGKMGMRYTCMEFDLMEESKHFQ